MTDDSGVYILDVAPLTLSDALAAMADKWQGRAVIADVDVNEYVGSGAQLRPIELREVAEEVGVEIGAEDGGLLALTFPEALSLLSAVDHYNATVIDAAATADLVDLYVNAQDPTSTGPVLPALQSADAYIYSHDNCYLHAEHRDGDIIGSIIGAVLAVSVGTALLLERHEAEVEIAAPPTDFVEELLGKERKLAFEQASVAIDGDHVRGLASREAYEFPDPVPTGTVPFSYDVMTGSWSRGASP